MPSAFVSGLINICRHELALFGDGSQKEYENSVYQRVGHYWSELAKTHPYGSWAGYNGKSGVKFNAAGKVMSNNNQPWSAAFISFVMREAGAGTHFSYAPSHSVYIVKALGEAKKAAPNGKFVARRHKEYTPRLGDLIACERLPAEDPNFDTYVTYVGASKYQAHCDVVVDVQDKYVITIGGNVSNSVKTKRWPLDAQKRIGNHDPGAPSSTMICVIENRL